MPINRLSVVIIAQFSSRERNIERINDGSKDAEINLSPKMVKICRNTLKLSRYERRTETTDSGKTITY